MLQFLVDLLSLAIALRVVGSGRCELDSEKVVKLVRELCDELGASVRHNLLWESMQLPYMSEI